MILLEIEKNETYGIIFPSDWYSRTYVFNAHRLPHLLEIGIVTNDVVVRNSVGFRRRDLASGRASTTYLPKDETN